MLLIFSKYQKKVNSDIYLNLTQKTVDIALIAILVIYLLFYTMLFMNIKLYNNAYESHCLL